VNGGTSRCRCPPPSPELETTRANASASWACASGPGRLCHRSRAALTSRRPSRPVESRLGFAGEFLAVIDWRLAGSHAEGCCPWRALVQIGRKLGRVPADGPFEVAGCSVKRVGRRSRLNLRAGTGDLGPEGTGRRSLGPPTFRAQAFRRESGNISRSEEHTSELQSRQY